MSEEKFLSLLRGSSQSRNKNLSINLRSMRNSANEASQDQRNEQAPPFLRTIDPAANAENNSVKSDESDSDEEAILDILQSPNSNEIAPAAQQTQPRRPWERFLNNVNDNYMEILQEEDEPEDSILDQSSDSSDMYYDSKSSESICNDSDWSEAQAIFEVDE